MPELEPVDKETGVVAGAPAPIRYRSQLAECREQLRRVASDSGAAQVTAMVDQAKLLRATLVLASGSPLGAASSALVPAAVSIELLHLASLVHDDIIDEAAERRGVPALHVTAGRNRALVVGDLLIVLAFQVISQVRVAVPAKVFACSVEALSKGAQLCCVGQLEELGPGADLLSEERYLDVVAKKTGSLFSVAASLGALIAGADEDETAALAWLGTELGIAYQIRDDLRDGAAGEPRHRRSAVRSENPRDGVQLPPTFDTYARAIDAVHGALDRVPAACNDSLRALVDAALRPYEP